MNKDVLLEKIKGKSTTEGRNKFVVLMAKGGK